MPAAPTARPADPFAPAARRRAVWASGLVLVAALVGAAVRLLPWVLDATIPWGTLAPFARSLLEVAVEASLLVGWPVGWALATARLVERGEADVLASVGESPPRTVQRLAPQALLFAALLGITSAALGRDAAAPGRIVRALLDEGRSACAGPTPRTGPDTHAVPFVGATWVCHPAPAGPRLVGRAPIGGVLYTASAARVTDDLRRIDLDDARLGYPSTGGGVGFHAHVSTLTLRGLAPWAQASSIPPALRAVVVPVSGLLAAGAAVLALLRLRGKRIGSVAAVAIGASGPLAALGALRALEIRIPEVPSTMWFVALVLVPMAGVAAVAISSSLAALLPVGRRSGTK